MNLLAVSGVYPPVMADEERRRVERLEVSYTMVMGPLLQFQEREDWRRTGGGSPNITSGEITH